MKYYTPRLLVLQNRLELDRNTAIEFYSLKPGMSASSEVFKLPQPLFLMFGLIIQLAVVLSSLTFVHIKSILYFFTQQTIVQLCLVLQEENSPHEQKVDETPKKKDKGRIC